MRNLRHYVLAIVLVILCGCSKLIIDASSNESMKQSLQNIREALPEMKRAEFDRAMGDLAFRKISMKDVYAQGVMGTEEFGRNLRESLDGKTVKQVIAEAESLRAQRAQQERQQALEEIRELEANRAKTESARNELEKFEVVRSRIHMRESESRGKHPVIELTVTNGTSQKVFKAHIESTLTSPDRSTLWSQVSGVYLMSHGLGPGEEATWYITPIMISDLATIDGLVDAVITITLVQLDSQDGEPIYSTRQFSEYDQKRLNQLKEKYGIE